MDLGDSSEGDKKDRQNYDWCFLQHEIRSLIMKKTPVVILSILLVAFGAVAEVHSGSDARGAAPKSKAPLKQTATTPMLAVKVGDRFEIDAGDLRTRLASATEDERPEQIADWVVYATLVHMRVPAKQLRD